MDTTAKVLEGRKITRLVTEAAKSSLNSINKKEGLPFGASLKGGGGGVAP